jgi:hypothetical protein
MWCPAGVGGHWRRDSAREGRRRAPAEPGGDVAGRAADRRRRILAELEAVTRRQDPWFAEGLRDGRPVLPWEYRQRGERLEVTALAAVQVLLLVVGWYPMVVAVGVVMLVWVARTLDLRGWAAG